MNFGALQTAVYQATGLDVNDGLITPTVVSALINRGLHAIEAEGSWPWLQSTETLSLVAHTDSYTPGTGTNQINFPAGAAWLRTSEVRSDTAEVVEWYSPTEIDDRWTPTEIGKPENFTIYADQIILRPVPDGVYAFTHRFERSEVDLVNPTDTPTLPAIYHEAIVDYTAYLVFRRSRETERMTEAQQNYTKWVAKMRARALRRADLPGKVRVRPYGWL